MTILDIDAIEQRAAALPAIDHRNDIWRQDSGGHNIVIVRSAADANKVLATLVGPSPEMLVFLTQARAGVMWLVSELRSALGALRVAAAEASLKEAEHTAALEAAHEAHRGALEQVLEEHKAAVAEQRELAEAADAVLRNEISLLKNAHAAEIAALGEKHAEELRAKDLEHQSAVEMLKLESQQAADSAQAALTEAAKAFENERAGAREALNLYKRECDEEIAAREAKAAATLAEAKAAFDTALEAKDAEREQALTNSALERDTMLATIREEHDRAIADREAAAAQALADKDAIIASASAEIEALRAGRDELEQYLNAIKASNQEAAGEIERLNGLLGEQQLVTSLNSGTIAQLEEAAQRSADTIIGLQRSNEDYASANAALTSALSECRRAQPTEPAPAGEDTTDHE